MALGGSLAEIRLILTGQRSVIAGLAATSAAMTRMEERVVALGIAEKETTDRSWLMNQALFTMRRYAYMGTLAVTGLVAVGLKMGYTFNQTMQSSATALLPVMHNMNAVRNELDDLFQIAKYSPFRFKDLTTGFRTMFLAMQPLGISAHTVTQTIQSLVDALAASGRTSEGQLNRVSTALQHMAYMGRLTGFTVNQLARDGIPIFGALNKELGISGAQLHTISQLGIPTQTVLAAINKFIETSPAYMNAAKRQAQTLGGEITTLKDNIQQTMGALTLGSFNRVQGGLLPSINDMFDKVSALIKKQKNKISLGQVLGIVGTTYPFLQPLISAIEDFAKVLNILVAFLKNAVIPTLVILGFVFETFVQPYIVLALNAVKFFTRFSWLLVPVLLFIIGLFVAYKTAVILWAIVMGTARAILALFTMATKLLEWTVEGLTLLMNLNRVAIYLWTIAKTGDIAATEGETAAQIGLGIAIMETRAAIIKQIAAVRALGVAFLGLLADIPIIGWIALAVIALTVLYFKWKWFHNLVNDVFKWMWKNWMLIVGIILYLNPLFGLLVLVAILLAKHWKAVWKEIKPVYDIVVAFFKFVVQNWRLLGPLFLLPFGPFAVILGEIATHWQTIIGWIKSAIDWVKKFANAWKDIPALPWVVKQLGALGKTAGLSDVNLPLAMATGGGQIASINSQVSQIEKSNWLSSKEKAKLVTEIHNYIHIDGKQVASSVAKHRQKQIARGAKQP
jgi:tape measure domain-containing protein